MNQKKNGEYTITALGKIIYCIQLMIEEAFENRWKLMAVDSVETEEEFVKFIDALIQNKQIKEFLMKRCQTCDGSSDLLWSNLHR